MASKPHAARRCRLHFTAISLARPVIRFLFHPNAMPQNQKVKVGIIGSGFEADIHAASFQLMPEEAEVVAVASPTPGNAERLAKKYSIPRFFLDYREMLKERDIEMVTITAPNHLHARMTIDISNAGKHVVCEKPLCITLAEADEMIHTCQRQGVLLGYAEELFFTPKYVKAKEMADQGGFGKVYLVKQSEKHFGPHSDWFWDVERSGGGALMDLGCHGIAFSYWFLGRPAIKSVYAQLGTYVHAGKTKGDDEAICIIEFDNDAMGLIESSWGRRGGMFDRSEVYGEGGVTYADLHMGNALPTYSEYGFGYAVEKAPSTQGWSYPVFEEHWNYGIPQEMRHFARCVRGKETLQATGEDGRVVMQVLYAAYASAGLGQKIQMPYSPRSTRPIEEWLGRKTK
jgi:myo-inositol 2-dehydrogenase / D-chiro-inositol 1-dehydrogenase